MPNPIPPFDHNVVLPPHLGNPTNPAHYLLDAGFRPEATLEHTRYWISLFSHNRSGVWKGMLRIELNTPAEDSAARLELAKVTP